MLFSIIVPIYKVEKYLKKCVESILQQTYKDFELILVDDGSPDCCPAICDEFAVKDLRIKVIHKVNGGLVSARKAGASIASGDFVVCVDGDDWLDLDYFEKMGLLIEKEHPDVIVNGFIKDEHGSCMCIENKIGTGFYSKERLLKEIYTLMLYMETDKEFCFGIYPSIWSKVVKRDVYLKSQMAVYDDITIGEDVVCSYAALLMAESVYVTNECYYHYRQISESMIHSYNPLYFEKCSILFQCISETFEKFQCPFFYIQFRHYAAFMVLTGVGQEMFSNNEKSFFYKINILKSASYDETILKALHGYDNLNLTKQDKNVLKLFIERKLYKKHAEYLLKRIIRKIRTAIKTKKSKNNSASL